jgi:hypothetical protein
VREIYRILQFGQPVIIRTAKNYPKFVCKYMELSRR